MGKPTNKADCYSAGERGWMELGQRLRAVLLNPLLQLLSRLNVSPDAVTLLAGLVGLGFVPFWLFDMQLAALACLLAHVLLDGVDGPLARLQGVASSRGSFTDTFADQVVVTGVTTAWMIHTADAAKIAAGTTYVFLYALVVAMAMVRNALDVPFSWLVRPRFFVYAALAIDLFTGWSLTLLVLIVCNLLLAIKCATGFLALRQRLPGPEGNEAKTTD